MTNASLMTPNNKRDFKADAALLRNYRHFSAQTIAWVAKFGLSSSCSILRLLLMALRRAKWVLLSSKSLSMALENPEETTKLEQAALEHLAEAELGA